MGPIPMSWVPVASLGSQEQPGLALAATHVAHSQVSLWALMWLQAGALPTYTHVQEASALLAPKWTLRSGRPAPQVRWDAGRRECTPSLRSAIAQ